MDVNSVWRAKKKLLHICWLKEGNPNRKTPCQNEVTCKNQRGSTMCTKCTDNAKLALASQVGTSIGNLFIGDFRGAKIVANAVVGTKTKGNKR